MLAAARDVCRNPSPAFNTCMVCDALHVLRCELKSLQRHAGQAGLSSINEKWCAPSQIFKHIPGTHEYAEQRERPAPTNNPFSQHLQSLCDLYTGPAVFHAGSS